MNKKQSKLQEWAKKISTDKEIVSINAFDIPTVSNEGKLNKKYEYNHGYHFRCKDNLVYKAYTNEGFEYLYYDEKAKIIWIKNLNFSKKEVDSTIDIYSINKILDRKFYIPLYQRGYKWDKQQIIDLLEDIDDFISKNKSCRLTEGEIYCIQPLVVKKDFDKWDVVDGQQRLTTIYLLLLYMNNKRKYSIDYEKESKDNLVYDDIVISREKYLEKPLDDLKMENIDFYHINLVWHTINDWFEGKNDSYKKIFLQTLLTRVSFIWYEIGKDEDPIQVFTRLNIGKIPLTDSELIKALFLNQNNFDSFDINNVEKRQKEIAMQWDQIEYSLQNDEFWCFLHNDKYKEYKQPTRIDFIFDLIRQSDKLTLKKSSDLVNMQNFDNDSHRIFRYFYRSFNNLKNSNTIKRQEWVSDVWNEVEKFYSIFKEWFNDHRIYHYIGYLTICEPDLKIEYRLGGEGYKNNLISLVSLWEHSINKECFITNLRNMIKKGIQSLKFATKEKLKNWVFEEKIKNVGERKEKITSKAKCRPVLLLHNIETILKRNEGLVKQYSLPEFNRFPFHLFQKESWEVEHIRSNAGDDVKDRSKQECFLRFTKDYLQTYGKKYKSLINDINNFLKNDEKSKLFEEICSELNAVDNGSTSALGDKDKNKIWNYTVLDSSTNEEYHNNIFPIKRAYILNKENGIKIKLSFVENANGELEIEKSFGDVVAFIPPCTKNIFTKSYSIQDTNISVWTPSNANDYLKDIIKKLDFYLEE